MKKSPNTNYQLLTTRHEQPLKVAIVCDWLTGTGGAERVVLELHKLYPDAPIYTSQYDSNPSIWHGESWFKNAYIRTSWLQKLPKSLKKFLPIARIFYFSKLNLNGYDFVISSSGAEAKGIRVPKDTVHVSYIHAPTHYYWSRYDDYLKSPGFGRFDWLARFSLKLLVAPLRKWDYSAAQRPDHIIANSTHTQAAIKKYYGRDSTVIFPPVDVNRFQSKASEPQERQGFVITGRQTPYKRVDLAVAACTNLNLHLTVIGQGPDHQKLKQLAGPSIQFLTKASDQEVAKHVASAEAFLFPGIDDFGIVAIEAMAAGTPVVAYQAGGALDYIKPGETGEFFAEQTVESLKTALENFKFSNYSPRDIQKFSYNFSNEEFVKKLTTLINKKI